MCDKMQCDRDLVDFVNSKKSKTCLKDQVSFPDFLDCLMPEIKDLYSVRLDEAKDEFDCSFAMSGKDQIFFLNFFIPTALLKTYIKVHNTTSVSECLPELFSIGASSATQDLFPEVTGICTKCAGDYFQNLRDLSDEEICNVNKLIIKTQFEHRFMDPKLFGQSLDDSPIKLNRSESSDSFKSKTKAVSVGDCEMSAGDQDNFAEENNSDFCILNPFSARDEVDFQVFNPFAAQKSTLEDNETELQEGQTFSCELCSKQFSENDFVLMHKRIFHPSISIESYDPKNQEKKVEPQYFESAENLIKKFCIHYGI